MSLLDYLEDAAQGAASARLPADIVYSARYYKPGALPSHYKIWRTDATGSRRVQVTSGKTDDHSPIWLADEKTILFVRETATSRTLCTVSEHGGPVTELVTLPSDFIFIESAAPNRGVVTYLTRNSLVFFDVATRKERAFKGGHQTAWSPDSRRVYITSWEKSDSSAHILDLVTGTLLPLKGDFRAAAFLDDQTVVAELFAVDEQPARLAIVGSDGRPERVVSLPFTWDDEDEEDSPFADNLFPIPGVNDAVLYGRHTGNSTAGEVHRLYRVGLKTGETSVVASGRDLSWSADRQFFITGDGRGLARLDSKRRVWVSPLSVVSFQTGKVRPLVKGLVSVGGFDWRPLLGKAWMTKEPMTKVEQPHEPDRVPIGPLPVMQALGHKETLMSISCRCCEKDQKTDLPRVCPECGHVFQGNGWDGIDAHLRAKHRYIMPYQDFWRGLCPEHRGTK